MKKQKHSYTKWLESAIDELKFAKVILEEQPDFPWYVCFHSQQAAEKALKSFLIFKKYSKPIRTHNLVILLECCKNYDKKFNFISESCEILNAYYIPTRYPDALPGMSLTGRFRPTEAKEAVETAQEIVRFVKNKIK